MFNHLDKPISNSIFIADFTQQLIWFSDYKPYDTIQRFYFHLIDPFLDHPPLAMIITAIPAKLFGYNSFTQIPQILTFLPAVIISIFSLFFTYILANKLFGQTIAYFSLLVYSFTPTYVFSHREPYLENFLTPIYLLVFILLSKYLTPRTKLRLKHLITIVICCALVIWIKLPALILTAIVFFWLFQLKKIPQALLTLSAGILSLITYFIFALSINQSHFLNTLQIQSNRGMDPHIFLSIITSLNFYTPFPDSLYFLGLIVIISLLIFKPQLKLKKINYHFFLFNFIFLLLSIIITTTEYNNFFWYRIPLYPFLSIATGIYLKKLLKQPHIFTFLPLYLLSFFFTTTFPLNLPTTIIRVIYLIPIFIFMIPYLKLNQPIINKIPSYFTKVFLVFLLMINILVILKYPYFVCQTHSCPLPKKIIINP